MTSRNRKKPDVSRFEPLRAAMKTMADDEEKNPLAPVFRLARKCLSWDPAARPKPGEALNNAAFSSAAFEGFSNRSMPWCTQLL